MAFNIKNVKNSILQGVGQAKASPRIGDTRVSSTGDLEVYTSGGWESVSAINNTPTSIAGAAGFGQAVASISNNGNLSIGNPGQSYAIAQPATTSVIAIETKVGRIGVDIDTGDITIPQGIGRDVAIREFWLGFQEHFQPTNKAKYEKEILNLKDKLKQVERAAEDYKKYVNDHVGKFVAEKIRKKYGNEKFIMVKPEDLIKFIES
jgi:hypothetical protein